MKKYINSRTIFISTLICIVLLFYVLSYNFFLTNFIKIEKIQNEKNINNLVNHFNFSFDSLTNISNTFIQNGFNIPHIEHLNPLGLDFIIYEKIQKKDIFSRYSDDWETSTSIKTNSLFETTLIEAFNKSTNLNTIFTFEGKLFYLVKSKINDSLNLYVGKLLDNHTLKQLSVDFGQLYISNQKEIEKTTIKLSSTYIPTISIQVTLTDKQILNTLIFKDAFSNVLFSVNTINQRHYVNEGKRTIHIVNVIMALFLAILLYVVYKSQVVFRRMLQKDKKALEIKVEQRTRQLEAVVKKVKVSNQQLHELAYTDFLTKIQNRRSFFTKTNEILNVAKTKKQSVCICMIDIDDFKKINDEYGHDIGDKVLVSFASAMSKQLTENDIFGRLGGEEFAIVFPNTRLQDALVKIEQLRKLVEKIAVKIDAQTKLKFTASFGISDNSKSHNIDKILHNADELLYSAKNNGKNTIRSRFNNGE